MPAELDLFVPEADLRDPQSIDNIPGASIPTLLKEFPFEPSRVDFTFYPLETFPILGDLGTEEARTEKVDKAVLDAGFIPGAITLFKYDMKKGTVTPSTTYRDIDIEDDIQIRQIRQIERGGKAEEVELTAESKKKYPNGFTILKEQYLPGLFDSGYTLSEAHIQLDRPRDIITGLRKPTTLYIARSTVNAGTYGVEYFISHATNSRKAASVESWLNGVKQIATQKSTARTRAS